MQMTKVGSRWKGIWRGSRFALKKRRMKVGRRNTDYMFKREWGKWKMQGVEGVKLDEFKHLRSTIQGKGQWTKEVEAGWEEWMETSVRGDV